MRIEEYCEQAQTRLHSVRTALAEGRAESVARAGTELAALLGELKSWLATPQAPAPGSRLHLLRLRRLLRQALAQAEMGDRLCSGWIQLSLSTGYTANGSPCVLTADARPRCEA